MDNVGIYVLLSPVGIHFGLELLKTTRAWLESRHNGYKRDDGEEKPKVECPAHCEHHEAQVAFIEALTESVNRNTDRQISALDTIGQAVNQNSQHTQSMLLSLAEIRGILNAQ